MDKEFTLEELKQADGQDGHPAYIAVDGVVYDVSNSGGWAGGQHHGFHAGNDLTKEIKEISPHGTQVLSRLEVVGKLVK
ncbi:MAG: cytochrome b5 domain-containing protein [Limosilactobacillus sp.]|uniref:cytochrome b5 domain-containing protein n=1 Tax=Limosilactobacillus sp. TaxID=2773925 RepID=UPI0027111C74|nr:cytochrome b5 domain-containing protein [Limosilactobacillus sp.]